MRILLVNHEFTMSGASANSWIPVRMGLDRIFVVNREGPALGQQDS